jgi:5-methylcytosine-specific restriction endonuclease McrA
MLAREMRRIEYARSSLPSSFNWKIRNAFYGKNCPICGAKMIRYEYVGNYRAPSIQHNIPISKGGKHELDNISVICKACNITLKDKETGKLNNDEVIKVWDEIRKQKR